MNMMKTALVLLIGVGVALAQAPKGTAKKSAAAPAMTAQKPAPKAPAAAKPAMKKPAAPAAAAKRPAPAKTVAAAKPTEKARRDPFVSPVVGRPVAACTGGKGCLEIAQLTIQGVVKTPDGMIAMVTNQAKKVYFLNENDRLLDGVVSKIIMGTAESPKDHRGDKVVFRQEVVDPLGNKSLREVVKAVGGPA